LARGTGAGINALGIALEEASRHKRPYLIRQQHQAERKANRMREILGIASPARVLVAGLAVSLGLIVGELSANEPDLRFGRLSAMPDASFRALGPELATPGPADIALYRRIFALQAAGDMSGADRLVARLTNRVLMGHVLAQRYLHPTAYLSSYDELARWLHLYADLPQAGRIHKLATKRRPPFAAAPREPARPATRPAAIRSVQSPGGVRLAALTGPFPLALSDAAKLPASPRAAQDRATIDATLEAVSRGRGLSRDQLWASGLAAWRLGDHVLAAGRFTELAGQPEASADDIAAAALWAARAWQMVDRPEVEQRFLQLATAIGDGFYSRLAGEMGDGSGYVAVEARASAAEDVVIFGLAGARRAAALIEVGETDLAVQELTLAASGAAPEIGVRLLAMVAELSLPVSPEATLEQLKGKPQPAHPLPKWQPAGGYTVDRALLWAISRVESNFRSNAVSPQGATGLMQIMPDTAASVARKAKIPYGGPRSLRHPATNLRIGQAYLHKLRRLEPVGDSLVHILLAYNAGIARVEAWRREMADLSDDPLMFIEAIPIRESRLYVKKVLANLWAYRKRLGQPSPSLAQLAANAWPSYEELEVGRSPRHARTY
jgi:soluble lytic murein transglycosylase